jgi:AraC-like DNA-binding protein
MLVFGGMIMEKAHVMKFKEVKTNSLQLNFCGYAQTESLHSYGPAVRPHYLIHCIMSGEGYYSIEDTKYHLKKGQGFLIEPDILTFYRSDVENPWEYVWIGFSGSDAKQILEKIGLNITNPIFTFEDSDAIYQIVKDVVAYPNLGIANELRITGLLYKFLSLIAQSTIDLSKSEDKKNIYVEKAIEFIKNNYYSGIKIRDIANYIGINRSYLYTLFTKYTGITPQQYLNTFRISRAKELLTFTDFSIESISISCGYRDPLVFAKAFRQLTGMSPSNFRREKDKKKL